MSFLRDLSSFWMPKTFVGLFWHISLAGSHPSPTQGVFKRLQGSLSPFRGETPSDRAFALQVDTPLTLSPSMDAPMYWPSMFPTLRTFALLLQTLSTSQSPESPSAPPSSASSPAHAPDPALGL